LNAPANGKAPHEGGLPEQTQTTDAERLAERFAAIPYRVTDAFALQEVDEKDVIILWWLIGHVTPPRWKYARHLSALAHDLRFASTDTLGRRLEKLRPDWIDFTKPAPRTRGPWVFWLTGAQLRRQDTDSRTTTAPLPLDYRKQGGQSEVVGEEAGQSEPAETDSGAVITEQDSSDMRQSLYEENRQKTQTEDVNPASVAEESGEEGTKTTSLGGVNKEDELLGFEVTKAIEDLQRKQKERA
jgi:hypothetical protein